MGEMVERIAKILDDFYDECSASHRQRSMKAARLVIQGMREPTEAMTAAGYNDSSNMPLPDGYENAYRRMIDEAMK